MSSFNCATEQGEDCDTLSKSAQGVLSNLEKALHKEGISKFSSKFIIEYVGNKLRNNDGDQIKNVLAYLLSLVNGKQEDGKCVIPGLRAKSLWGKDEFPWLEEVERNFVQIRTEFLQLREYMVEQTTNCANHSIPPEINEDCLESDLSPVEHKNNVIFQPYRNPASIIDKLSLDENANLSDSSTTKAVDHHKSDVTDRGQWNVCYLMLHDQDFTHNQVVCPATMNIVQ